MSKDVLLSLCLLLSMCNLLVHGGAYYSNSRRTYRKYQQIREANILAEMEKLEYMMLAGAEPDAIAPSCLAVAQPIHMFAKTSETSVGCTPSC